MNICTSIKAVLWLTLVVLVVGGQLMMAECSPQHAEFLKMFFWDFPCMVIERILPGIGS